MVVKNWFRNRSRLDIRVPSDSEFEVRVDLDCIRREMVHALRDCGEPRRSMALQAVNHASAPIDLWLLRPDIFMVLETVRGRSVAARRISALTPLFRGWVATEIFVPAVDEGKEPGR